MAPGGTIRIDLAAAIRSLPGLAPLPVEQKDTLGTSLLRQSGDLRADATARDALSAAPLPPHPMHCLDDGGRESSAKNPDAARGRLFSPDMERLYQRRLRRSNRNKLAAPRRARTDAGHTVTATNE